MNKLKKVGLFLGLVLMIAISQSCKNDNPSIIKVFVRSASNELVVGAKVVIIGDINSNPATNAYVDTLVTNNSGYVAFNMDDYFTAAGPDNTVGYYDIVVKANSKTGFGYVRGRVHTTAVETVYLPN
jgi:hypothetical protein